MASVASQLIEKSLHMRKVTASRIRERYEVKVLTCRITYVVVVVVVVVVLLLQLVLVVVVVVVVVLVVEAVVITAVVLVVLLLLQLIVVVVGVPSGSPAHDVRCTQNPTTAHSNTPVTL